MTIPGETVLYWLVASAAGCVQYFVILPRILNQYAKQVPLAARERLLVSCRVPLVAGLGWAVFFGLKASIVSNGAGSLARYAELQHWHHQMPMEAFISNFERLHHAAHRFESLVLWPIVLCLVAVLYALLVHRTRLWHFAVLVWPAAYEAGDSEALDFWQYFCFYLVSLALTVTCLQRYFEWRRRASPKRTDEIAS